MATNADLTAFAIHVASLRDSQNRADPAAMLDDIIRRARVLMGMPPAMQEPLAAAASREIARIVHDNIFLPGQGVNLPFENAEAMKTENYQRAFRAALAVLLRTP